MTRRAGPSVWSGARWRLLLIVPAALAGCSDPSLQPVPVEELAAGACVRAEARAGRVPAWDEELLVERTHCYLQRQGPRAPHVPSSQVLSGAWVDRAREPMERLVQAGLPRSLPEEDAEAVEDFDVDLDAIDDLPPPWRTLHETQADAVRTFMRASRAQDGRVPAASLFNIFAEEDEAEPLNLMGTQQVYRLAGWRIRADALEGRYAEALELCADALALAADHARPGLIGAMFGGSFIQRVREPCGLAVEGASPDARRRFLESMAVVSARWPAFSELLEVERLFFQLGLMGGRISAEVRARLPQEAHRLLGEYGAMTGREGWGAIRFALFGGYAHRKYVEQYGRLIEAGRLPPAEAAVRYEALAETVSIANFLVFPEHQGYAPTWTPLHARSEKARSNLDAIAAVAAALDVKARTGRWPTDWSFLPEGAAVPRHPETGRPLPLLEAGSPVWLVVPEVEGVTGDRAFLVGRSGAAE